MTHPAVSPRLHLDDVRRAWESRDPELTKLIGELAEQPDEAPGTPPREGAPTFAKLLERGRKLVTLHPNVPLKYEWDKWHRPEWNSEKMQALFQEYAAAHAVPEDEEAARLVRSAPVEDGLEPEKEELEKQNRKWASLYQLGSIAAPWTDPDARRA